MVRPTSLKTSSASGVVKMPEENTLIPSWDGDPSSFEQFVQDCRWYESSLKSNERTLAASRIWRRLTGAAKSVVRHLNPLDYDSPTGLQKLLDVLRASPLQQLPVPDSFSRLERWSALRRAPTETIPQLLVREEDRFVELQQALNRARTERVNVMATSGTTSTPDPTSSPSRGSPAQGPVRTESATPAAESTTQEAAPTMVDISMEKDFFGDELRGYRLLKAARLSHHERQHILTLTANSTRFVEIRRALRTLFADGENHDDGGRRRNVWWAEHEGPWDWTEVDGLDKKTGGLLTRRPTGLVATTSTMTTLMTRSGDRMLTRNGLMIGGVMRAHLTRPR